MLDSLELFLCRNNGFKVLSLELFSAQKYNCSLESHSSLKVALLGMNVYA